MTRTCLPIATQNHQPLFTPARECLWAIPSGLGYGVPNTFKQISSGTWAVGFEEDEHSHTR